MIDMRGIYHKEDFQEALEKFNQYHKHKVFKSSFLNMTSNKCPYCEVELPSRFSDRTFEYSIDHYRPKAYYPNLEFDYKNYVLMCNDCNNAYKNDIFLLYENGEVVTQSNQVDVNSTDDIDDELPLIVNPIVDDIFEYFIIRFKLTNKGKVLELYPKYSHGEDDFKYKKAIETIRLLGLGECEKFDTNRNIDICRVNLLKQHFVKFYRFLQLWQSNQTQVQSMIDENKVKNYGFVEFITKNQYKVMI